MRCCVGGHPLDNQVTIDVICVGKLTNQFLMHCIYAVTCFVVMYVISILSLKHISVLLKITTIGNVSITLPPLRSFSRRRCRTFPGKFLCA